MPPPLLDLGAEADDLPLAMLAAILLLWDARSRGSLSSSSSGPYCTWSYCPGPYCPSRPLLPYPEPADNAPPRLHAGSGAAVMPLPEDARRLPPPPPPSFQLPPPPMLASNTDSKPMLLPPMLALDANWPALESNASSPSELA